MDIMVTPLIETPSRGTCRLRTRQALCALGSKGCTTNKREGDGKTPYGRFLLRRLWYRPDRLAPTHLPQNFPCQPIARNSVWSDDPKDPAYNRPAKLPYRFGHERLWRADALYDVFFELGYNDAPPIANRGSAIFLHLASLQFAPTRGCVAIAQPLMLYLLSQVQVGDALVVAPPEGADQTQPRPA